jgi:hypothetical protein
VRVGDRVLVAATGSGVGSAPQPAEGHRWEAVAATEVQHDVRGLFAPFVRVSGAAACPYMGVCC